MMKMKIVALPMTGIAIVSVLALVLTGTFGSIGFAPSHTTIPTPKTTTSCYENATALYVTARSYNGSYQINAVLHYTNFAGAKPVTIVRDRLSDGTYYNQTDVIQPGSSNSYALFAQRTGETGIVTFTTSCGHEISTTFSPN